MTSGPWYNSLRIQIVVLLTLALLPLGAVAIFQTKRVAEAADRNAHLALIALTEQSARAEQVVIEQASGAARVFGAVAADFLGNPARCTAELSSFLEKEQIYSFVGYIPSNGVVECSSAEGVFDFSDSPRVTPIIAAQQPTLTVNTDGPISGQSVFVIWEPYEIDGEFAGFVTISIPHTDLPHAETDMTALGLHDLITFNDEGTVFTSRHDLDSAQNELPAGIELKELAFLRSDVYLGQNALGERRTYTISRIVGTPAYVLGVWSSQNGLGDKVSVLERPALFPILMWVASMSVAMLAIYTLVLRHITRLRRNMRAFALRRTIPPTSHVSVMPNELQALNDNFLRMTDDILRDEAGLEDSLREKGVLIKEIHHRVKNNLQLISSIMSMQIRAATEQETKQVLSRLQDRVLSLATIHRDLYQSQGGGRVNVGRLINEVVEKTIEVAAMNKTSIDVDSDIDQVLLYPDQAVPLSLMTSEAATNAMKYIGTPADGSRPWVKVSLKQEGDECLLVVGNSVGPASAVESTGLGAQLIRAFSIQLGSKVEIDEQPDSYTIKVRFQPQEFQPDARDF